MASFSGVGNVQSASFAPNGGEHENHAASQSLPTSGQTFSSALSQAIGQASGGGHAGHGASPGTATLPHVNSSHATAGKQSGSAHSRHFTIGENHHGENHGFQETVLRVRAYRQQLIASNIANADTPGYQAVDLDFQEALRIARSVSNVSPVALSMTSNGHIPGLATPSASPFPIKYVVPKQPSADGNTVDMDAERGKFAENALMWGFARDRVSGHFKHLIEMLMSLKD